MSEMRACEPSRVHLKKELTQIRKAARVLRDPGTTSSWKSPLSTSRSVGVAASGRKQLEKENVIQNGGVNDHLGSPGEDKRVFLHNWNKSSGEKSGALNLMAATNGCGGGGVGDDPDDDGDESCSVDDSLSRNGESRSGSGIFRCRDADLVLPARKAAAGIKKKSKRTSSHHRQQKKEMYLRRLLKAHPSLASELGRDDLVQQQSDDVEAAVAAAAEEGFSNSDDFRRSGGTSPLLSKLKHRHWSLRGGGGSQKEDYSSYSTPALSASSYTRYRIRNPSTVGSWDATTIASLNDGYDGVDDDDDALDLPARQGCGIPCYWSRRSSRSCCSPSLSDTLRKKGSSIFCGSQSMYHRRRRSSSISSSKQRIASRSALGVLPLLTNSGDGRGGSSIGTGHSDDELSTNFGELDLEALSRLDGGRWSSCKSQDGMEIVALNGDAEEEGTPENIRSLSQKYKPVFFDELIGQNIVVQSLINALSRGRIAPVYLFHGPRGTGKTSAARIFASALNCTSVDQVRPCGYCRECIDFISGKSRDLWEVDGANKKGVDRVRYLLEKISRRLPVGSSCYKVFLINECHLLPSKMWLAFLKFLEEPPSRFVFIFITTDPDNVPRTVQSRCQKYLFNKIRDADIVSRLRKISVEENLDVEMEALDLIAFNADGSLRDAETMLDQLSLLGKKITTSLVNELVGVVSDDKLLELLGLAMSSDTAETVKRARDLMDSGVDPMVLMSQLASLIMDIIAGTYGVVSANHSDSSLGARNLTEAELERLKRALKLLSEAEKQLRVSSDRSTWFTATLLQLGSVPSPDLTQSSSSWRQSSRTTDEDPSIASGESNVYKQKPNARFLPQRSSPASSLYKVISGNSSQHGKYHTNSKPPQSQFMDGSPSSASQDSEMIGNIAYRLGNSQKLDGIWEKCIEKCHSKTLRQLLHVHSKLLSISEVEGILVAYVGFGNEDIKCRAERFVSSITNSIEMVLRHNVEVRLVFASDGGYLLDYAEKVEFRGGGQDGSDDATLPIESGIRETPSKSSLMLNNSLRSSAQSPEKRQEIPMHRIESIIREQRLETAWLQAAERGTPGSLVRLKPEKNQVHPQEEMHPRNPTESLSSVGMPSQHWEDELNHELKVLKMQDRQVLHKEQTSQCAISPSLLHDSNAMANASKESLGYDSSSQSGGGCTALFCWNTKRPQRRKAKGTRIRSRSRNGRFSLFGVCGNQKKTGSRVES
ncbi:hypothetical protein Tsubulata_042326 [Turnera subulata]|uniref:AAA+ ATPase domain-containing protein n=1 Tax=Turnera subulata TaxID=218843 RepID=A0A9Q0GAQ4_9ROSI|nr:hypothetical protein Tsubulata_042326 [Turnera subulata]